MPETTTVDRPMVCFFSGEPKHLCLLIQIFNELCHIVESQQRTELELRRPLSPIPNELGMFESLYEGAITVVQFLE